jgi:hypothetical protein
MIPCEAFVVARTNQPAQAAVVKGKPPGNVCALVILTAATLACLCPFLGKAFHIDDPLFIWSGRHLLSEPWNFYNFNVNWYGKEEAMSAATQNPPLAAYYMAFVGLLFGWSEIALHAGFLLPALAAVLGTYRLAQRFCVHPLAAGLVTITAPVFLVCSTSIMCDTMMLTFWVWSLVFWTEGLADLSPIKLGFSALLIAACGLTKYFGFALVPLVLAYSVVERRGIGRWLAYLLFPVFVLVCYEWLTHKLYGRGALSDGFAYASNQRSPGHLLLRILVGLTFSGGSIIIYLASAPLLWGRRTMVAGAAALVLFGLCLVAVKRVDHIPTLTDGHINWLFVIQISLFGTAGTALIVLATADLLRHKTAAAWLLFLWVTGTFVFTCVACWQTSGRYLLPMLPAASILLIRRLELRHLLHDRNQIGPLVAPLGVSLVIALMAAWADFKFANSARDAATHIQQEVGAASHVWFEGHWGFQYYMERAGARPIDFRHPRYSPNDVIVLPLGNSFVFNPPPANLASWFEYDCAPSKYFTTMSASSGAGFYSDDWGPLPFVICQVPVQQYLIYHAK